jgi:hypothetical protein
VDEIQVGEVKMAGQRGGHRRQRERLGARLATLRTGTGVMSDGTAAEVRLLGIPYRTHLDALAATVARARRDGYAELFPEAGMLVVAVDLDHYDDVESELGDWMLGPAERHGWAPRDDRHFGGSALVAGLRDRHRNSSYLAPLPLFPLPAADIVDLLLGTVDYVVTLRAEDIERAFASRGITAQVAAGTDADDVFLRASRSDVTVTVSAQVREQMLRELMVTGCLVDVVAAFLDDIAAGAPTGTNWLMFCDERQAWPRAPVLLSR